MVLQVLGQRNSRARDLQAEKDDRFPLKTISMRTFYDVSQGESYRRGKWEIANLPSDLGLP